MIILVYVFLHILFKVLENNPADSRLEAALPQQSLPVLRTDPLRKTKMEPNKWLSFDCCPLEMSPLQLPCELCGVYWTLVLVFAVVALAPALSDTLDPSHVGLSNNRSLARNENVLSPHFPRLPRPLSNFSEMILRTPVSGCQGYNKPESGVEAAETWHKVVEDMRNRSHKLPTPRKT